MVLLLIYVGGALSISFICSILEATLLSVREIELEERKARGEAGATLLLELKTQRIDDSISAILILNTIAHTAGAALAGAQAGHLYGDDFVAVFSAVLIFLVLFFTEIIPKTLGTVHASRLASPVARVLQLLVWLLTPALILTRFLTGFLSRHEKRPITRGELAAMVAMASREGTLGAADSRLVANVLRYDEITVADVMTPRTVLRSLPVEATIADFLADHDAQVFSRIPLFEDTRDHMVGYVLQRELLLAVAEGTPTDAPLRGYLRPAFTLDQKTSVAKAMRILSNEHQHLALVSDRFGGTTGLVTLEDLVETILGVEILDETDRVPDLRSEAIRLRDQRLQSRGGLEVLPETSPAASSGPTEHPPADPAGD